MERLLVWLLRNKAQILPPQVRQSLTLDVSNSPFRIGSRSVKHSELGESHKLKPLMKPSKRKFTILNHSLDVSRAASRGKLAETDDHGRASVSSAHGISLRNFESTSIRALPYIQRLAKQPRANDAVSVQHVLTKRNNVQFGDVVQGNQKSRGTSLRESLGDTLTDQNLVKMVKSNVSSSLTP